MNATAHFDHDAIRLAVAGLRSSFERQYATHRGPRDVQAVGITAVETCNWICAIDELLWMTAGGPKTKAGDAYKTDQSADENGRVIPGIRFVRDRHMHQVVISARGDGVNFFARFPPQLSAGVVWRPVEEIPLPLRKYRSEYYQEQREAYRCWMQHATTWKPLNRAVVWLTAALDGHGVQLPNWRGPWDV